ncbi:MAG: hypothetical protein ACE5NC_00150 [Anaerolineae bacterium]
MEDRSAQIRLRILIRNFLIELVVYGLLVVGYFFVVLRVLAEPLQMLFGEDLIFYAIAGLILMVAQAVALEWVTSFLVDRLGLERLE